MLTNISISVSFEFEFQFQKFEVVVFAEQRYEGKMYLSIRYGNKRRQLEHRITELLEDNHVE